MLLFREMLDKSVENTFIGFGNPESKILIIGKECSGDGCDYHRNLAQWKECKDYMSHPAMVGTCNQKFKRNRNGNGGTSPTWLYYQSLVDRIRDKDTKSKEDNLDFLNYCFTTELHDKPSKQSEPYPEKKNKIQERIERLFSHDYWRTFDVIIVAAGNYPVCYDKEGYLISKLGFDSYPEKKHIAPGYWYDKRLSSQSNSRVLIFTRQLSRMEMDITNRECLFQSISDIVKPYFNK